MEANGVVSGTIPRHTIRTVFPVPIHSTFAANSLPLVSVGRRPCADTTRTSFSLTAARCRTPVPSIHKEAT